MATCPVCQSKVTEKARFCADCGTQLATAASDRAWIVAMQERIRSIRHNDVAYNICIVVGVLIAVAVPFLMRYVLHYSMDNLSWMLTIVGIVLFIGGFGGAWYDDRKVNRLLEQLAKGQRPESVPETGTEAADKADSFPRILGKGQPPAENPETGAEDRKDQADTK